MRFTKELLKAVDDIDLRARRKLSALLAGNYRSSFRGSGMHFKEFRQYEPGDDIRHMSWQVTARTGHPTIKLYEEERDLNVLVMVDVSGSSLFGAGNSKRLHAYAEISALLGLAAIKSQDNAGFLFFDNKPTYFLPPKRTRSQVKVALTELLAQPLTGAQSDLRPALNHARRVLKNPSLIAVISDFLAPDFFQELLALSRKHEVVLLHCKNDLGKELERGGVFEIWDAESGEFLLLDASSEKTLQSIKNEERKLEATLKDFCQRSRADYFSFSVEEDYLGHLVRFFRGRGPKRV